MEDGGIVSREGAVEVGDGIAEFAALTARLASALDAIDAGAVRGGPARVAHPVARDDAEPEERIALLEDELETERSVTAQLDDRIMQIRARHEATVARIEAEAVEARATLAEVESEMRQLRAVNDRLRETSRRLRDACAKGVVDAEAVNEAMRAEIDSLREARTADRREIDGLIAELSPLVERESA